MNPRASTLCITAAVALLGIACGDESQSNEAERSTTTQPASPLDEPSVDVSPDPTNDSSDEKMASVVGAAVAADSLDSSFYELTLVRYADKTTIGDFDHDAFLPPEAELVYVAEVERQLQGATEWDRIEVVLYPDGATYLETVSSSEYIASETERAGLLADSHIALTTPVTPISGEPLVAGEEPERPPVPAPSEDPADPSFVLVAAVEIVDQEALERHYAGATGGGSDLGVRPVMWMDVGITLVGDEPIDSIRFNYWSSHSAFQAVISSDPDTSSREEGLGQASTMMTLPFVDEFTPGAVAPIELQLDVEEIAALYTSAAMSFLEATTGFTECLAGQGQPWVGEPDVEDPDVDPATLLPSVLALPTSPSREL